ncbi:Fungal specific transcription factor domain-containing protein [Cladophialophora immunda]|nr:Fungal specific transcription factor domain-containing protein [Cladophialophora immunda]
MRSYLHYVHPFLPLLDLEDIMLPLNDHPRSNQISVVLYQAVMFAAASFVSMEFLQKEGFNSQLDARKCLFQRVKLLVDFDVENDLLTLIKVLVLMTYWYDKPDDPKGRVYWMIIALSFAYEVGLDRDSELVGLDAKQQRSRRRLWWCCYVRDKLISFSERRPSGIRDDKDHLAILTADDFEPQLFSRALRGYPAPGIVTRPEILIELSIEHMKLCVLLGRVLDSQYLASGHRRTTTGETMMMLLPRTSEAFMSDFMVRDQEIIEWGEGICSRLSGAIDIEPERNCRLVSLHSAVLEMVYHTALSMLHRPLMALKHPTVSAAHSLHDSSRQKLRDGARRITEIAKYLGDKNLLKHVPPIGVTALLAAAVQHVKDTTSNDTDSHDAAVEGFRQAMHALLQLREVYASAGHAISFIETVRERTGNHGANENDAEQNKILYPHGRMNYSTQGHEASRTTDSHPDVASVRIEPSNGGSGLMQLSASAETAHTPSLAELAAPGAGPLDFETVSNLNSLSEILLSESFGASDFDGMDWTSIFQDPESMGF